MAFSALGAGGGALSGAATGAQLGSIVPGIGTGIGAGVGAILGGIGGSNLFGGGSKTGQGLPTFNPQQALQLQGQTFDQMSGQALGFGSDLFNQAADQGISFAKRGTKANIANQEAVTPGSAAQRELALQQINSYIQGQVPQDVQQQINRQVAQNLGGGFNLFSGGGQAPNAFARNIGQTSVGLSQYGLSAAPTWQQLANSMVTKPEVGLQAGIQAGGIGAQLATGAGSLGNDLSQSQYQSGFNQYKANQFQDLSDQQLGLQLGKMGFDAFSSKQKGDYYGNLSPSKQGEQNTLGLPSLLASLGSIFGGRGSGNNTVNNNTY
jgi:hypothetical protein